jgi:very-short-patch-repair endonuclease
MFISSNMNVIQINWRLEYNPKLKERTRELRKNMTEPEKKLWYWFLREISNNRFRIYKQRPINNFIVDFYIPKLKFVIEIDWESHFDEQRIVYDIERTAILEWLWLKVIRFTNEEVMKNFEWVCEELERKLKS